MESMLIKLPNILEEAEKLYQTQSEGRFKGLRFDALNMLICGDNAEVIKALSKNTKFDFVYIDPPFYSGTDYKARINDNGEIKKTKVYTDTWKSLDEYLVMLTMRLLLIKDVLKDSGTVAVHLDTHASHYVKIFMDEIFGEKNFVNEIIWSYKSGGCRRKAFAKKHDTILVYSKTSNYYFCPQKEKSYNRDFRPYKFKGVKEYQDDQGRWYTLVNQKDVINIDMVGRTSSERTGYATQKPEKLLDMLVKAFCPVNGLCGDFFCGSGGMGVAAANNNCNFILCDISEIAVDITAKRLASKGIDFK